MNPRTWAVGAAVLIACLAAGAGLLAAGHTKQLEHTTVDWRYGIRGPRPAPKSITIVALDSTTGAALNARLPPSRSLQQRVVRNVTRAGAAQIAYDLALNGTTTPDADFGIVRALSGSPRPVVSVTRFDPAGNPDLLAGITKFGGIPVRAGHTLRTGSRWGTWIQYPRRLGRVDPFPAAVAAARLGVPRITTPAHALIDYRGLPGAVPVISFSDVLRGRFDHGLVRGRTVIVGATAPELQDVHIVPLGGRMSGPEVQANAIATALAGFPLRGVSEASSRWTIAGLAVLVPLLLLGWTLARLRRGGGPPSPLLVLVVGGLAVCCWAIVGQVAFDHGTVVDWFPGLVALVVATCASWLVTSVLERRRYRSVRRRFARGDDEELIAAVLEGTQGSLLGPQGSTRIIQGYALLNLVGGGAMGHVYEATDLDLCRRVALKVIHPSFGDDPAYRQRFLKEAEQAAAISNPYAVQIFSRGEQEGLLYISMQFVPGQDLATALTPGEPLGLLDSAELVHRVARALDALHLRGLVHCDVKPANILLSDDDPDHPYLTDFGVARAANAGPVDSMVGSPAYMAPEQAQVGARIGPEADVYALGAVAFRLITGRTPFAGTEQAAVLAAHASAPRPRASPLVENVPPELDDILARAMAIAPEARYGSATAFSTALVEAVRRSLGTNAGRIPEASVIRSAPGEARISPTGTLPLQ